MPEWSSAIVDRIQMETHFDGRELKCFTDRPADLNAMFAAAVARAPDDEAVVSGETRFTYTSFDHVVGRIAAGLKANGIVKGDRVALLISNRWEFTAVMMGCLRLGAIAVPINIRESAPELEFILQQCGARIVVHGMDVADRLPERRALPALEHIYCVGGDVDGSQPFSDLMADAPFTGVVEVDEEDVAVILYTSGTTGQPKGATLTHFNIVHSTLHFEAAMELGANERSLLCVPASHVTGLIATVFTSIHTAGCAVMMETFAAHEFLTLVADEKVTLTLMVPAMYNLFLLRCNLADYDLAAWRIGGYGGAPMAQSTIAELSEKLPNLCLMNAYGATELTSAVTILPIGYGVSRSDSIGVAMPCAEIRLVDEKGQDVPEGEHGELWIKSPMTVPGYWNNPERTQGEFQDGYWKSGDMGSRDAEGFICLHDRRKDMIIRGGYNIYSVEVENALMAHPSVIECAAIGRPDPVLGEKMHVFIHTTDTTLDRDAIRAFAKSKMADYKAPDFVTFDPEPLPRNANGKIVKNTLRASLQES
ncbi:acyl-CoA synthetase (AMP-forming)/AMP-acid ligase II [Sulfitobacter undariae]|uniref:Acyl-CoA synthetase (AMP-forming)/AMP-acid ligase II n=1 Tax=Sulfitobacter undariae TaxID=1563671 RepID=A0A7W6H2S7_9RHOB|nr:class I adenylate-forming enzyme family protein [Sulfitobacter undariae]MBB3995164.1 acyl-CoA synthetase (AMP-forming)/AMP-acid ligase II [Sulfitobacter undariae]